jgi:hypothetical protein
VSAQESVPEPRARSGGGWQFAVFRAWREREHPKSSYQIAPHVWRPEHFAQIAGEPDASRRALKNWEPRFTGMAYSDRAVYLVDVVAELTAEIVGKALYCAELFRRDPDYDPHRDKPMHLIVLARSATTSICDFARRRHIRVVVLRAENAIEGTDSRESIDQSRQKSAAGAEAPCSR